MRTVLGSVLTAVFAVGCGITVIVEGETRDTSGGETSPGGGGGSTGGGTATLPNGCGMWCSVPPSGETCACQEDCSLSGMGSPSITCAPNTDLQGNHKVECICTLPSFSGACYETDMSLLCDFEWGCCGKYFSGK